MRAFFIEAETNRPKQNKKDRQPMSEHKAKEIASTVVEWLYANGKIPESIYGKMTMDGDGADGEALAQLIKETYES